MTLIRRAQAAAATAAGIPELPSHYATTLANLSGATMQELEDACTAVELLDSLKRLDAGQATGSMSTAIDELIADGLWEEA